MLLSVITFNINSGSFAPEVHWSADHGFFARWPYSGRYVQAAPCYNIR